MTITNIATAEADDGRYWVRVAIDGGELKPRGPYRADEVEAVVSRIAGMCRSLSWTVTQAAPAAATRTAPPIMEARP